MAALADNDEVAADRGAHPGYGPPDNSGHKRCAPGTSLCQLTWANAQDQRRCLGWACIYTPEIIGVL
jgi:hypothetical protein